MLSGINQSVPKIDTLIPDIYKTLLKGTDQLPDETYNKFGSGMAKLMKQKLRPNSGYVSKGRLRLSAIGKKDRQIWYEYHGYPRESMNAPTLLKFLIGDVWEAILLFLSKAAGHEVTGEQEELDLEGVKGHRDCIIDGVPVDIKSASSRSFLKFKDGSLKRDDPFGYMHQLAAYREADAVPSDTAAFLAGEKQNGELALMKLDEIELPNARKRVQEVKEIVKLESPPTRCYTPVPFGKSGNMKLPVGCSYCGYKKECYKDVNEGQGLRTFLYSTGPVYLTEVKELPKVFELTKDKQ